MDEKMNAIERTKMVLRWLQEQNIATSNRRVAELMKYNQSTLSLILNGKIAVKERFAYTLCGLSPKLNPQWLLSGEGDMLSGNPFYIAPSTSNTKEEEKPIVNDMESAEAFAARMEYTTLLKLISRLEKNMNDMKEEYEARISNLEEQIEQLSQK